MKRTGTSLSLSENEMDSDVEVDLSLAIKQHQHQKSSRSTPQSPVNETNIFNTIENIDGHPKSNFISLISDSTQTPPTLEYINSEPLSVINRENEKINKNELGSEYDNEVKSTMQTITS